MSGAFDAAGIIAALSLGGLVVFGFAYCGSWLIDRPWRNQWDDGETGTIPRTWREAWMDHMHAAADSFADKATAEWAAKLRAHGYVDDDPMAGPGHGWQPSSMVAGS